MAIGIGDTCRIVGGFRPPLDLEGVDARINELRNMVDHIEIPGVHDIGAVVVLFNGEILAGTALLHQRILPAARLGTGTVVGIPSRQVVTEQAPAGKAHAHGPVDKGLQLQCIRDILPDLPDLREGQLSCQHHPGGPHVIPCLGRVGRNHPHLRADMTLHFRSITLRRLEYAQIAQNKGIYTDVLTKLEERRHLPNLSGTGQHIGRHIDLNPTAVAECHGLFQLFIAEISAFGPHTIGLSGQIHRISPIAHGHLQPFRVSCRRKQLGFIGH